jgi:hypothetical protein
MDTDRETPDPDLVTEETNPTPDEHGEGDDPVEEEILDDLPQGVPTEGTAPLP